MKYLILLLLILLSSIATWARTIRVGILDTGYSSKEISNFKHCDYGMSDVSFSGVDINDNVGHGNNILHIITDSIKSDVDYCIIIIKIMDNKSPSNDKANDTSYNNGIIYATKLNLDILNISFTGIGEREIETFAVKYLLNKGTFVVAAAGNYNLNLNSKSCTVYPACIDPRIIVVGCLISKNKKCEMSNYGSYIKVWELGDKVTAGGYTMSGTSQATALATSKLIKVLWKRIK